jgi:hypothetical protein
MYKLLLAICAIATIPGTDGIARVLSDQEMAVVKGGQWPDSDQCPGLCIYDTTCFAGPDGPLACVPVPNPPPPAEGTHCYGAFAVFVTTMPQDLCTADYDNLNSQCNLTIEPEACTEYDIHICTIIERWTVSGTPPIAELTSSTCWSDDSNDTLVDVVIEGDASEDSGGSTTCGD